MSRMSKTIAILGVVAGLGVTALPLSTYAEDPISASKDATVQLTVEDTISLELEGTAKKDNDMTITDGSTLVNLGIAMPDGEIVSGDLTATIKTNSKSGYSLKLADADASNDLMSGSDTIPAGTPAKGKSAWGFMMGGVTVNTADGNSNTAAAVSSYIEVPVNGSEVEIVNSGKPTLVDATDVNKSGDTAVITFGASVSSAQAAGTYSDVVVVTASVNS